MSGAADAGLDLVELRDSAREVLADAAQRAASARELWQTLASLGWLGLGVTVEQGGLGQPFAACAVLYEEMGRRLAPHTFIAATACLQSLSGSVEAGSPAAALMSEALQGAVILADATGAQPSIRVENRSFHGVVFNVPDLHRASHLLLRIERGGPQILAVALAHPAITLAPLETWDETRRWFDVHLDGVPEGDTIEVVSGALAESAAVELAARVDLAMACDAVGGADALFGATLEYLQIRRQFDRPIAAFQAIKHRCADLAAALAGARALTGAAGRQFAERETGHGDWRAAAAACRLHATAVYRELSEEAVQLHGGVGFTWDHDCHRHLKRARCSDVLGGPPERRKDAVAAALFLGAREGRVRSAGG